MKDIFGAVNPNDVIRPVQALAVEAVELFNSLTIAFSSSSFAPEYSDNHQVIADRLANYQDAKDPIQKLRRLLEERDAFLRRETEKPAELESQQQEEVFAWVRRDG
jgi:hypothetical protein